MSDERWATLPETVVAAAVFFTGPGWIAVGIYVKRRKWCATYWGSLLIGSLAWTIWTLAAMPASGGEWAGASMLWLLFCAGNSIPLSVVYPNAFDELAREDGRARVRRIRAKRRSRLRPKRETVRDLSWWTSAVATIVLVALIIVLVVAAIRGDLQ